MKTCPICNKEHEDNQQHLQNGDGVCATTVTFDDVVRAAGTSEGAKKGLEEVDWSVKATWTDAARKASADARRDGMKAHEEHDAEADDHFSKAETQNDYHWRAGGAHSATAMALRDDIGVNHFNAARSHKAAAAKAPSPEAKNLHERFYKLHGDKAAEHGRRSPMGGHHLMNASATTSADVVHCRASGASTDNLQATEWRLGETVAFMWMPAGVHTITAGFRSGSINLTVACDQQTADAVNASLRDWRDERPKQEPFGCVEHREQEASVRVGPSCGFEWRGDGVYLAAEPTKLGADNVNGKVHRSWSPSFTTDAEYAKAVERDGVLYFPDGVRGSRSNPARITGVDFCVGTLTNKPAFRAMSPVKAAEADATAEELAAYERCVEGGRSHQQAVDELRLKRKHAEAAAAAEKPTLESIHAKHAAAVEAANRIAAEHGAARLTAADVYERFSVKAGAPLGNQNAAGHHDSNMLRQNLSEVETDFDKEHGVSMRSPNSWASPKHKLFGYSTARQLRNAIKKKISASDATPEAILERIYARAGANR